MSTPNKPNEEEEIDGMVDSIEKELNAVDVDAERMREWFIHDYRPQTAIITDQNEAQKFIKMLLSHTHRKSKH